MSLNTVKEHLASFGAEDRIMIFAESSATVDLAARDIGCDPSLICKTMAFENGPKTLIIAMAGDARIDNRKFKDRFHTKARMLKGEEVIDRTSHPVGGVCPFGLKEGCEVYLDTSLKRFEKVYPACGSPNSAICLTIDEMEKFSGSDQWVDVTKLPE